MNVDIFLDDLIQHVPSLKDNNFQKKLYAVLESRSVGIKDQDDLLYVKDTDLSPSLFTGVEARKILSVWGKKLKPSNSPSTTDETENVSKRRKASDIRPDPCGATYERMDSSDSENFKGTRRTRNGEAKQAAPKIQQIIKGNVGKSTTVDGSYYETNYGPQITNMGKVVGDILTDQASKSSYSTRIENSTLVDSAVNNVDQNADISYGPRDDKEEKRNDRRKDKQEGKKARPTNNGTNKNGQTSDHQTTILNSDLDRSSVNNIGGDLKHTHGK